MKQQAGAEILDETGVGTDVGLERAVWVEGYGDHLGPGLALNQRIVFFTHLFYNFVPDPAWRFVMDGPPSAPA